MNFVIFNFFHQSHAIFVLILSYDPTKRVEPKNRFLTRMITFYSGQKKNSIFNFKKIFDNFFWPKSITRFYAGKEKFHKKSFANKGDWLASMFLFSIYEYYENTHVILRWWDNRRKRTNIYWSGSGVIFVFG